MNAMGTITTLVTSAEFERLPNEPCKLQLMNGELIRTPPAETGRMRIALRINTWKTALAKCGCSMVVPHRSPSIVAKLRLKSRARSPANCCLECRSICPLFLAPRRAGHDSLRKGHLDYFAVQNGAF